MASSYPGGLDAFTNPTASDTLDSATVPHADQHSNANDAIEAIESTLGVNPQGGSATVVARLTALDSTVAGKETPSGAQAKADAAQAAAISTASADATTKANAAEANATAVANTKVASVTAGDSSVTVAGTSTAPTVAVNQSNLTIAQSQVTDLVSDLAGKAPATGISPSAISGTAVITTDSRLSDARTPTAHATSHGVAGSDPVTVASSQVTGLAASATTDTTDASNITSGTLPDARLANTGTAGTYTKVTTDSKGRVTSGTTLLLADLPSGVARTGSANAFTVGGHTITSESATVKPLILKGAASQTANLQEWQDSNSATLTTITSAGRFITNQRVSIGFSVAAPLLDAHANFGNDFQAARVPILVRGAASQTADLQQWQASNGTVLGRINSFGSLRIGTSIVNTAIGLNLDYAGVSSGLGLVIRGAASQTADLMQFQNSAGGVIGYVTSAAVMRMEIVQGGSGAETDLRRLSGGGVITLQKATSAVANPGTNYARLYLRDGTTTGTLKLVVRAGTAGAETTILDNIPTT